MRNLLLIERHIWSHADASSGWSNLSACCVETCSSDFPWHKLNTAIKIITVMLSHIFRFFPVLKYRRTDDKKSYHLVQAEWTTLQSSNSEEHEQVIGIYHVHYHHLITSPVKERTPTRSSVPCMVHFECTYNYKMVIITLPLPHRGDFL